MTLLTTTTAAATTTGIQRRSGSPDWEAATLLRSHVAAGIIAIDTSVAAVPPRRRRIDGHPLQGESPAADRPTRLRRRQPVAAVPRRTRSHSPSRRSPKLRHTNGRLHPTEDVSEAATNAEIAIRSVVTTSPALIQGGHGHGGDLSLLLDFPQREDVRRSHSCAMASTTATTAEAAPPAAGGSGNSPPTRTLRRFKIFYRDEALRESCTQNTRRMIESARRSCIPEKNGSSSSTSSTARGARGTTPGMSVQQQLALKALKYRKLLDRMHEIDDARLNDPSFDVHACLGVQWCKV